MVRLRQGLACGAYVRIGDDTNRPSETSDAAAAMIVQNG